jgi:hypothetical protein
MKIGVVGAGPTGWATTRKLVDLGHEITVIATDTKSDQFARGDYPSRALNKKLLFGSDYPYRPFECGPVHYQSDVNVSSSFARAGLSLVWGATMLPYASKDIENWPIGISELAAHYEYLGKHMPICGRLDALASSYLPVLSRSPLLPSQRILSLIERSNGRKGRITVGASRLAVETGVDPKSGCYYCNLCLDGCKDNFIWSAPLIKSNLVSYELGFRAIEMQIVSNSVSINTLDSHGNKKRFADFDKVFLAAGPIESFRILATSGIVDSEATLKDSATFFVPFLTDPRIGSASGSNHSLAQAFIRIEDSKRKASQIQIYEYSDNLIPRAKRALPLGKLVPDSFLRPLLSKLLVGIGYLHSAESREITMALNEDGNVELSAAGLTKIEQKNLIELRLREVGKDLRELGLIPVMPLIEFTKPGEGVHYGGWLPMGDKADILGSPNQAMNIHLVDTSIFPSIPAGAITFSAMANAVRIAETVAS